MKVISLPRMVAIIAAAQTAAGSSFLLLISETRVT